MADFVNKVTERRIKETTRRPVSGEAFPRAKQVERMSSSDELKIYQLRSPKRREREMEDIDLQVDVSEQLQQEEPQQQSNHQPLFNVPSDSEFVNVTETKTVAAPNKPQAVSMPEVTFYDVFDMKQPSESFSKSTSSIDSFISFTRQKNLPPKDKHEDAKHLKEHKQMMRHSSDKLVQKQKKEEREKRERDRILEKRVKQWLRILKNWDENRNKQETRRLWWFGIPPSLRGRIWRLVIGDNLRIRRDEYQSLVERGANAMDEQLAGDEEMNNLLSVGDKVHSSIRLIQIDAGRTFPALGLFQPNAPLYQPLLSVLSAIVVNRPDVGYVQGMSFIAGILLINMEEYDAFVSFSNMLTRPFFTSFFMLDIQKYINVFNLLFAEYIPELYVLFIKHGINPEVYLIEWFMSMYARCLSLDIAMRVWDCYFLFGEVFLFRTALGLLRLFEDEFAQSEYEQIVYKLTHLGDVDESELFQRIEGVEIETEKYLRLLRDSQTVK